MDWMLNHARNVTWKGSRRHLSWATVGSAVEPKSVSLDVWDFDSVVCCKTIQFYLSSIGTTAHCGLWPVEQYPSIFFYPSPNLSIFSLPALEHLFLLPFTTLPLLLVPSSSWVKIFLDILFSSILSRWPNQLILCPFIHFTIFSPLLISSSSRFILLFHSPFSYLGPYILLNIFL